MDPETVLGQIEALCTLPTKRSSTADKVLAIIWGVSIEPAMRYDYGPDDPPATKLERIEQICSDYPSAGKAEPRRKSWRSSGARTLTTRRGSRSYQEP